MSKLENNKMAPEERQAKQPLKQQSIEQNKAEQQANHALDKIEKDQPCASDQIPRKEKEIGGPKGLEPTRYGDWEAKGRCYDF